MPLSILRISHPPRLWDEERGTERERMLKLVTILLLSKHLHTNIMISENEIFRAFKIDILSDEKFAGTAASRQYVFGDILWNI